MVSVLAFAALPAQWSWAAVSTNLTTVSVANVGPATVFAGAKKVPVLSFTLHTLGADTFRSLPAANYSSLTGAGYLSKVVGYQTVYAYSRAGGRPGSPTRCRSASIALSACREFVR